MKLTAVVVAPALAVEILLGVPRLSWTIWVRQTVPAMGIKVSSVVATYFGLLGALGTVPLDVLWGSHFSTQTLMHAGESLGLPLWPQLLLDHVEAVLSACGGERLRFEVARIRCLARVEESGVVAKMRQYADRTRWVYTRETIYFFHAGLVVVTELAVLPSKRFWSGQITDEQIWITVKEYQPEQLLLQGGPLDAGIKEFVEADYTLVCQERGLALYVAKTLVAHER